MTQSIAVTQKAHHAGPFSSRPKSQKLTDAAFKAKIGVHDLEMRALEADGTAGLRHARIPALPLFQDTFAAFAQGTVIEGEHAPVAVEDIQPGDHLQTSDGRLAQVRWVASSQYAAGAGSTSAPLTRVVPDSFGFGRPNAYVTLGPAARLLQTPQRLRATHVGRPLLAEMSEFVDGVNVIEITPPNPVRLFHIGLDRHAIINASGLLMESFHPNMGLVQKLPDRMGSLFLSLFPNIQLFSDFGPIGHMRATRSSNTVA